MFGMVTWLIWKRRNPTAVEKFAFLASGPLPVKANQTIIGRSDNPRRRVDLYNGSRMLENSPRTQ